MKPHLAFDAYSPVLVTLHAVVAIVLSGAAGHLGVLSVRRLLGYPQREGQLKLYATVVVATFGLCLLLGLLAYPHYRYFVRGLQLDRDAPWASNLFDFKENLAALTLPLTVVVLAMERDGKTPRLSAVVGVLVCASTAFLVVSGLVVTLVKGA